MVPLRELGPRIADTPADQARRGRGWGCGGC